MANDRKDNNLNVFRQQALIVARRKDQAAERLTQLRAENDVLEKQYGGGNGPMAGANGTAHHTQHIPQGEEVLPIGSRASAQDRRVRVTCFF
jgi:hypothetical protein